MNIDLVQERYKAQRFHEILFLLNIGFAIAYALFAYDGGSYIAIHASKGVRDFLLIFGQTLRRIAPMGVHNQTKGDLLQGAMIYEAVFAALVLGIALILHLFVRLSTRTATGQLVLARMSGMASLVAVPGCWLYIVHATWPVSESRTFWGTCGYVSLLEIVVASGLLYFVRNQAIWRGTLVFALQYVFWVVLVVREGRSLAPVAVSIPLSLVFPCSGFAWLRYVRALRQQRIS